MFRQLLISIKCSSLSRLLLGKVCGESQKCEHDMLMQRMRGGRGPEFCTARTIMHARITKGQEFASMQRGNAIAEIAGI